MYKFKRLPKEELSFKGKRISPKSKNYMRHVASWLIQIIKSGKDLYVYPGSTETLPFLADVLLFIDQDSKLSQAKAKAQAVRYELMLEQSIHLTDRFKADPSPENAQLVEKHQKNCQFMKRKDDAADTYILELENLFESVFVTRSGEHHRHIIPFPGPFNRSR